jgi:hypothetical protein
MSLIQGRQDLVYGNAAMASSGFWMQVYTVEAAMMTMP